MSNLIKFPVKNVNNWTTSEEQALANRPDWVKYEHLKNGVNQLVCTYDWNEVTVDKLLEDYDFDTEQAKAVAEWFNNEIIPFMNRDTEDEKQELYSQIAGDKNPEPIELYELTISQSIEESNANWLREQEVDFTYKYEPKKAV